MNPFSSFPLLPFMILFFYFSSRRSAKKLDNVTQLFLRNLLCHYGGCEAQSDRQGNLRSFLLSKYVQSPIRWAIFLFL